MLDDLIRAALNDAGGECVVPETVDQAVWSRVIQGVKPGSGGTSDE